MNGECFRGMNIFKILIIFLFVLNSIISCNPEPEDSPPTIKPYDPDKAGAEIIESYDLSAIYVFKQMDYYLHLSEYNNKFYIIHDEKIHIYNKNTMVKEETITFDIKDIYPDFNTFYKDYYYNEDIAVFNNKILFSYTITVNNLNLINKRAIFDIDISGDNFRELDVSTDFGLNNSYLTIGNNSDNNKFVILTDNQLKHFGYDNTNDKYHEISSINMPFFYYDEFSIKGDIIWYMYISNWMTLETFIEKRDLRDPNKILVKINADYLGTQIPESILFDGEYLWIIAEKDGKMQLLKLRPL